MPQDLVSSGYAGPPPRALKGSRVLRPCTPGNVQDVDLGRLPFKAPPLPGRLSDLQPNRIITALLTASVLRMEQARVRFRKLLSNTVYVWFGR